MKRQWTRYAVVALFACLLGALAHASISRAVQGNAPNDDAGNGRLAAQEDDVRREGDMPQNSLLRELWKYINQADDLSDEEKSEALEILEEADPILRRIKKENELAVEILRNPPRMVIPKQPAKEAEKTPAPADPVPAPADPVPAPADEAPAPAGEAPAAEQQEQDKSA
jgi:hypothetical protein